MKKYKLLTVPALLRLVFIFLFAFCNLKPNVRRCD